MGGDSNSSSNNIRLVLRVDAPVFVPASSSSAVLSATEEPRREDRHDGMSIRGDLDRPPPTTSTTSASTSTRNRKRRNKKQKKRSPHEQQQPRKPCRDQQDQQQQRPRTRRFRRRRGRRNHNEQHQDRNEASVIDDSLTMKSTEQNGEVEEEDFPMLRPEIDLHTGCSGSNNISREPTRSIWNQTLPSKVLCDDSDDNGDNFEDQGLDSRLYHEGLEILTARPLLLNSNKHTENDDKDDNDVDCRINFNEDDEKKNSESEDGYTNHCLLDRGGTNVSSDKSDASKTYKSFSHRMGRLRDKWWDAMTKRQQEQRQQQQQQQQKIEEEQRIQKLEKEQQQQRLQREEQLRDIFIAKDIHAGLQHDENIISDAADCHAPGSSTDKVEECEESIDGANKIDFSTQSFSSFYDKIEVIFDREDTDALRSVLISLGKSLKTQDEMNIEDVARRIVKMAVTRNHPQFLRLVMSYADGWSVPLDASSFSPSGTNPFFIAADRGYEECLSVLMSGRGKSSTLATIKDGNGNNILHICCKGEAEDGLLRLLLNEMKGRQQSSKLLLGQNNKKQTPLHVACERNKTSFVDVFLNSCTNSILAKMLVHMDDQGQTPLFAAISNSSEEMVLALIMWRGNHTSAPKAAPIYYSPQILTLNTNSKQNSEEHVDRRPCPLVWAANQGDLHMVDLLLQFGDQWARKYRFTEALMSILKSSTEEATMLEGCHMLVTAGANPFEEIGDTSETPIGCAAHSEELSILKFLIKVGMQTLQNKQARRRDDPVLRKRPPVFFRQLEEKEAKEIETALRNALVLSLVKGHQSDSLAVSVALYEAGVARLEDGDLARLQMSMLTGQLRPPQSPCPVTIETKCFIATYNHDHDSSWKLPRGGETRSIVDRSTVFSYNTKRCLQLPWVKTKSKSYYCSCPWIRENGRSPTRPSRKNDSSDGEEVILVCSEDGSRFIVHPSVVSPKSGKIESAIRFANMRLSDESVSDTLEVPIDGPSYLVDALCQHIYHGSLFFWSSPSDQRDDNDLCLFLLELMLFGEEFLCPSLVQECEMRILSHAPRSCVCWSCCQVATYNPDSKKCECLFYFEGRGKTCLINSSTALSILGVTDYTSDAPDYDLYHREPNDRVRRNLDDWRDTATSFRGLSAMRDMSVRCILKEFRSVIESESFTEHVVQNDDDCPKELLLRLAIDALKENQVVKSFYRSTPPQSLSIMPWQAGGHVRQSLSARYS